MKMLRPWADLVRRALSVLLVGTIALWGCSSPQSTSATNATGDVTHAAQESSFELVAYAGNTMSYLGPEGTYTQEACARFFAGEGSYLPYETVDAAVKALLDGASDYAVIPQENAIGGPVTDYIDVLLATPELSVVGEVELPISQNLLVLPGTALEEITTVYSHKQGIAQGKTWLAEHLPDASVLEVSSTAEGARMVADGADKSCAAIASAGCADVYGLELLAANIQQNDNNKTRFYVLSLATPSTRPSDRMAFVATGRASSLTQFFEAIKELGIDVISIHDRPEKTELGHYRFVVECAGGTEGAYEKISTIEGFEFRNLGSFPVH